MNHIGEVISGILTIAFIQALILIPLTILALFIRQWVIRRIRKIRYQQKQKLFSKYDMDLSRIPEGLHYLIPYAKEFGTADTQQRLKHHEEISAEQKRDFVRAVRGKEDEIIQWLKAIYPFYSKEATAFAYVLKSMSEMRLMVEPITMAEPGIDLYVKEVRSGITNRLTYYQPKPQTWIEKLIYDIFSWLVTVILFPLYYFLIAKIWSIFSPGEDSTVAFGIICTLAVLLSLFTYHAAKWAIKRVMLKLFYDPPHLLRR